MLAVQNASMGSSKPPNLEMPFGYSFDDSGTNHPFPSPTAPAPGPSLLDDNESRLLTDFIDGVSSDQFNYDLLNLDDGATFGIGWEEVPTNFMGNSSSYGQHSHSGSHSGIMGLDFGQINTQLVPSPAIGPIIPDEVLQAAALLQNVPNGRSNTLDDGEFLRSREDQYFSGDRSVGTGLGIMSRPLGVLQHVYEPRPSVECYPSEPNQTEVIFDGHSAPLIRNRGVNLRADIRWGSDVTFTAPQGFTAPSSRESVSAAERYHLQTMESALSLSPHVDSADMSCPPQSAIRKSSTPYQLSDTITNSNCIESDQGLVACKRRKNESQEEEEEEELLSPSLQASRSGSKKRKSGMRESTDSSTLDGESNHHKRKRSTTSAAMKSTRENLTEEQKRENHIKSEQKRRTLIREGFEDLNELVPGLQGGGYSKSAVLAQAADWLEDLIRSNENLRTKILMMESRAASKPQ